LMLQPPSVRTPKASAAPAPQRSASAAAGRFPLARDPISEDSASVMSLSAPAPVEVRLLRRASRICDSETRSAGVTRLESRAADSEFSAALPAVPVGETHVGWARYWFLSRSSKTRSM